MLGEWLRENANRRREIGVWDCCTFPAQWAMEKGHDDPMANVRGQYSTEEDAHRLIDEGGGLAELFRVRMGAAGLFPVDSPAAGDIGVLSLAGDEAGAIYTGERWAFLTLRGMGFATIPAKHVLTIWRPAHG